jgi:tRNA A-37 threonylcarbamoyl transferase component Bud32
VNDGISLPVMDRLSEADYAALVAGAEPIKHMREGVKVWLLADGRIVKLFRPRGRFSRSRLWPPNRRFALNAERLRRRGFVSVDVLRLFVLETNNCFGVVYQGVRGQTLESSLREELSDERLDVLARLLARLHRAGVLFRSLHLGNLIVVASGELALIDVEEARFGSRPLSVAARARNFHHLLRRPIDRELIDAPAFTDLLERYLEQCGLSDGARSKLRARLMDLRDIGDNS